MISKIVSQDTQSSSPSSRVSAASSRQQPAKCPLKSIFDTIVILGPTGSGKTEVSLRIAERIGGEIISADSGAVYKGMDIGTAKPTRKEQARVPHWGLDLVEPDKRFTVADWKEYAEGKIQEIRARGKVPMIVGGTGLYIDALVYDYQFTETARKTEQDRREICTNYLLIGVQTPLELLRKRLTERVNKLFVQELYDETERLAKKYGWNLRSMKNNIYQYAWQYLQGELGLEEAKQLAVYADWHLAKRQLTWFKRNEHIKWLPLAEIEDFVLKYMQDE